MFLQCYNLIHNLPSTCENSRIMNLYLIKLCRNICSKRKTTRNVFLISLRLKNKSGTIFLALDKPVHLFLLGYHNDVSFITLLLSSSQLKDLRHDNICAFIGACTESPNICIITEYCSRGSLKDVLENEDVKLDNMFLASMVADIIRVGDNYSRYFLNN